MALAHADTSFRTKSQPSPQFRRFIVFPDEQSIHHQRRTSVRPQAATDETCSDDQGDPETELLKAARECQRMIEMSYGPSAAPASSMRVKSERSVAKKSSASTVRKPAPVSPATRPARTESPGRCRIQLRLSRSLVRILKAFQSAGYSPGRIVETALWNDTRIQDASILLNASHSDVNTDDSPI